MDFVFYKNENKIKVVSFIEQNDSYKLQIDQITQDNVHIKEIIGEDTLSGHRPRTQGLNGLRPATGSRGHSFRQAMVNKSQEKSKNSMTEQQRQEL